MVNVDNLVFLLRAGREREHSVREGFVVGVSFGRNYVQRVLVVDSLAVAGQLTLRALLRIHALIWLAVLSSIVKQRGFHRRTEQ